MKDKAKLETTSDKKVQGITCFAAHAKFNVDCNRKSCRNWIEYSECKNCVLIAAQEGPYTLQEVGKIFNLTRMRICQIEKIIKTKIKNVC